MNPPPFVNSFTLKSYQHCNNVGEYDAQVLKKFVPEMLDAHYWQQKKAIVGTAQGRGTTYFIKHKSVDMVLRHYYRGGLVGKLIRDSYVYTGLENTRAKQEFDLLVLMVGLALPVPKPIAYRVRQHKLVYQADILTARINNAQDLVSMLQQRPLSREEWCRVGNVIAHFHHEGIYHHDLNCHNILLDNAGKVWLIDFDQGKQLPLSGGWQQQNLARLQRSFIKESKRLQPFYWHPEHWSYLQEGYLGFKR